MKHDALAAHGRDELGISDTLAAQPVQAALASAGMFAVGAALPLLMVLLLPVSARMWGLAGSSLFFCTVGPPGCTCRGRTRDCVRHTRHFLGGSGNGIDRWSWSPFWGSRLRPCVNATPDPSLQSTAFGGGLTAAFMEAA
jgi:hypothetical protein